MSAVTTLTFEVECSDTQPGEEVFVTGGLTTLGAWDPAQACLCTTSREAFPQWTSSLLRLPTGVSRVEFKILVQPRACKKADEVRWECGANRVLQLPMAVGGQSDVVVGCAWGAPEVHVKISSSAASDGQPAEEAPSASDLAPSQPPTRAAVDREPQAVEADAGSPCEFVTVSPQRTTPRHCARFMDHPILDHLEGIKRRSSRRVVVDSDRTPNVEMSRKPSMMLKDAAALEEEAHEEFRTIGIEMSRKPSMMMLKDAVILEEDAREEFQTTNVEMSRKPSMVLNDAAALEEECARHATEVEELERQHRLNWMQRRLSGSMLEETRKATMDFAEPDKSVLLQGFNWESWRAGGGDWYSIVGNKVDTMAEMGITDVWLPPCSASVAEQGYAPSKLFDLDGSKYGGQASLEGLLRKLHAAGIRGVADIVINPRSGVEQDDQGRENQLPSSRQMPFARREGKLEAERGIDHESQKVQQSIGIWLRWLRLRVGFDAWRFDFAKGCAPASVGLYCRKSEPVWAVGELWKDMQYDDQGLCHCQDRHRQDLCNWVNGTGRASAAFDFTTKGILQEACRNGQYWRLRDRGGKPPGLIGWMPRYAVTFIDNHDTGSTQRHWPFPDDKVLVGYAYIITHSGIPCILWDHMNEWGEDHRRRIADLLKARREAGITASAPVDIQCADHDLYIAEVGSPPAIRVALGPRWSGDPDRGYWSERASGRDYRVWVHRAPPKEESTWVHRAPPKEERSAPALLRAVPPPRAREEPKEPKLEAARKPRASSLTTSAPVQQERRLGTPTRRRRAASPSWLAPPVNWFF